MKLAIISPWPPDQSGIADYTYDLVKGISQHGFACTVYTLCENPKLLQGCKIVHNRDPDSWDLSDYELRVYHFGNNTKFHRHMHPVLEKYPGIVHLHDYVLQHLRAGIAMENEEWDDYYAKLAEYYGEDYADLAREAWAGRQPVWERSDVIDYPMNEWVLKLATGVVTHSHFARRRIGQRFPTLAIGRLDQVYDIGEVKVKEGMQSGQLSALRIGVFGHIQRNKCLHVLLEAMKFYSKASVPVIIRAVGDSADEVYFEELMQLKAELPQHVEFSHTGYVDDDTFMHELESCDLCVALRYPTMGETSAIVMRALQLQKLVVVTDLGWYSELPDFVYKISEGQRGVAQLADYIDRLVSDDDYRHDLVESTVTHARLHLNYKTISRQFAELLWECILHAQDPLSNAPIEDIMSAQLARVFTTVGLDTVEDEGELRDYVYNRLIPLLPHHTRSAATGTDA